jgi:D-arginine dehydrogenase
MGFAARKRQPEALSGSAGRGMTDQTFDIVIIGAGIAGASAAAELASTHRVAVLEREDFPGYHSTGRSAALFSEIYGNAAVRALSRASRDFFHAPPQGFSEHPLVRKRGALHIASARQLRSLEDFAANADLAGSIRRITGEEALGACSILRPDYVAAAVIEDDAADVDVHALHQAYLRRFRSLGGTLMVNAQARSLSHRGGEWHIDTGAGIVRAPIVVDAAGAWADGVAKSAGAAPLFIQPCRRTAVLVELPPDMSGEFWPMVIDIDEKFYMKPDAGLLLISPADETATDACDVQAEEIDVATAIDRIEQVTSLQIRRVRKRWAGLRSFAPDRSPVIGFDAVLPGFFWLAGQGGYGIQTAPAAARLAASLLRDGTAPAEFADIYLSQLSPQRFGIGAAKRSGT